MGLYKITRPDGSVEYTDVPSGPGRVDGVGAHASRTDDERREDYELGKSLIKEAQKRIPKVKDYLEYLEYLRTYHPLQFDEVMSQLKHQDPATWQRLQRYPQFRPLRETAVGLKATNQLLQAATKLPTSGVAGSFEYWLETTLKSMMKRDRFGPYADVLGSRGSLPPKKGAPHPNTPRSQYMSVQNQKLAAASAAAIKELELSEAGLRAARGSAVVRSLGPFVDLAVNMLNVETASSFAASALRLRARSLFEAGVLDELQWAETQQLLSAGEYVRMQQLMDDALISIKRDQ